MKMGFLAAALLVALPSGISRAGGAAEKKAASSDLHQIANLATKLDDLQATVRVTKLDSKELEKIGRDFSFTYRIHTLTLQYKQPDKMRLTGKFPALGEARIIVNGTTRLFDVPRFEKKVEDLEKSPSKRQSLLEYGGLVAPETLRFMQGSFVKQETLDGHEALVFDMTYQGVTAGSHYRVWIDPETRITIKREWYNREDKLKATFLYLEPREVEKGIWLPSRVEVKNADGVTAATTTLDDIKVNQGISDSLFTIKL